MARLQIVPAVRPVAGRVAYEGENRLIVFDTNGIKNNIF